MDDQTKQRQTLETIRTIATILLDHVERAERLLDDEDTQARPAKHSDAYDL
jgi:hypothetical protein